MCKALSLVLLLLVPAYAEAETWLTASLASYHFERKDYCEVNPGFGIEHGDTVRFVAGTYHNSLCQTSNYAGVSFIAAKFGDFRVGVAALAITGYEKTKRGSEAIAAVLPVISYEREKWGVNMVVIPPYSDFRGCLGWQLKVRF